MPGVSWTGWSRRTRRWCGCTSTGRRRAVSVVMPPPHRGPSRLLTGTQGAGSNYKNPPAGRRCGRSAPVVAEPADHGIGRSRGGLTTKVHLLADGRGRPLVLLLTAGNVNDTTMFAPLLAALQVARAGHGPAADPAGLRAGRQGLQLAGQPGAAAAAPRQPHDPRTPRSAGQPASPRQPGWAPGRVRQDPLPAPQRRRTRGLPAQALARAGHSLRPPRPQLPRRTHPRRTPGLASMIQQTHPSSVLRRL